MTDIYDIKDIIFSPPISVFNSILVCIIFLVIYLLFFRRKEIEYFNDSVDGSE
ncbi:MAG: hypothetical protein LBQ59_01365 [Candidatus Peribacteria bacterium]|jgi:hypothetical protein|nr:hypothetical protein [Candidatus Peribacteria bacterium]